MKVAEHRKIPEVMRRTAALPTFYYRDIICPALTHVGDLECVPVAEIISHRDLSVLHISQIQVGILHYPARGEPHGYPAFRGGLQSPTKEPFTSWPTPPSRTAETFRPTRCGFT